VSKLDIAKLKFDSNGLIPVVAQDAKDGEVLMVAYMNAESLQMTFETGVATYWSRSRKKLWKKGESSGNVQKVKAIYTDCDADTLVIKIEQIGGAACHTGNRSCFYINAESNGSWKENSKPLFNPEEVYKK
jgi:phosphoribosyl-AMP cyclohydrolase